MTAIRASYLRPRPYQRASPFLRTVESASLDELFEAPPDAEPVASPVRTRVPAPAPTERRAGRRLRTALGLAVLLVVLASIVYAGMFALSGGRWYIVRTPSMGQAAPVGTLLWVRPTDNVQVGDMITFRPPDVAGTYSHRIHAIAADGTITTKGDANSSTDPWRLSKADIIGKVTMRWWGIGWLVRGAPILILGAALLWFLTRRFANEVWRLPLRVVGSAVLVSVSLFVLRPLVGAQQIVLIPTDPGLRATYVSTGLLPLHLSATGGTHTDLVNGQTGTVTTTVSAKAGRLAVELAPNVAWWWWLVLAAICFLPAFWTTFVGEQRTARQRVARHARA